MESFEFIGTEFIEIIRSQELKRKIDFVNFFIVYYEFTSGCEEYDELFDNLQKQQEFLINAMDEACVAFNIDYDAKWEALTDLELEQLWWYMQIALAAAVFKSCKPMFVQHTTNNLKARMSTLTEEELKIEMMFLNVLLEDIPFAPRPIFNTWYGDTVFMEKKDWFLDFYKRNESAFSVKKLKDGLLLPYSLPSQFLTNAELSFDVYIVSLFEILKAMNDDNAEILLTLYTDEFFKNMCVQRAVKKEMKDEFLENTKVLGAFLLQECEENEAEDDI
jgi:hypothetical protein